LQNTMRRDRIKPESFFEGRLFSWLFFEAIFSKT
jgi:hypothetical protein